MSSSARLVLLAALCAGALLIGIELFITAVALPRIVPDLGDWTQLRRASWIVNAYLVAYIAVMPLAGRAADRFGLPALVMLSLGVFAVGSALSGAAQDLGQLILARIVQGAGAGAILPLATAGASHLYEGHARSRAIGLVNGATFLGMALGPLLGSLVLEYLDLGQALRGVGIWRGPLVDLATPAWRWVFYGGAPLAVLALLYVWAVAPEWRVGSRRGALDVPGALLFSLSLAGGLVALTLMGEERPDESFPAAILMAALAILAGLAAWWHARRTREPFIDPHLLRDHRVAGAVAVSLLTGYGLATAIIGSAVFVDRVHYSGPDEQRVVLGALALATAIGALASGLLLRAISPVLVTLLGLGAGVAGLVLLAGAGPASGLDLLVVSLGLFGLGFGLTVTAHSSVAVEAAGRGAFGMASAAVTVARMTGMAVGLAVLTGLGTTRIDALSGVLSDPAARDLALPERLRGRPLEDPLVIAALEAWAADQAAAVLGLLFLAAAVVTLVAAVPAMAMRSAADRRASATAPSGEGALEADTPDPAAPDGPLP